MQKKQCGRLIQIAYYQAGKIVVQTLLPQHPPVALITLNIFGITSSTSADTHIPFDTTQCCSSLESRLIGLYGGKAASLLFENQMLYTQIKGGTQEPKGIGSQTIRDIQSNLFKKSQENRNVFLTPPPAGNRKKIMRFDIPLAYFSDQQAVKGYRAHFTKIGFAGAGNNPFQSNVGNVENQAAHRLASTMVKNWNFYSIDYLHTMRSCYQYPFASQRLHTQLRKPLAKQRGIGSNNKSIDLLEEDFFYPVSYPSEVAPYFVRNISVAEKKHSLDLLSPYPAVLGSSRKDASQDGRATLQEQFSKNFLLHNDKTIYLKQNQRGETLSFNKKNMKGKLITLHLFIAAWYKKNKQFLGGYANPLLAKRGKKIGLVRTLDSLFRPKKTPGMVDLHTEVHLPFGCIPSIPFGSASPLLLKLRRGYGVLVARARRKVVIGKGMLRQLAQMALIRKIDEEFLRFAISQTRNRFQICATSDFSGGSKLSYNDTRTSVEDIGEKLFLSTDAFQIINPLQFSNVQRNSFNSGWFRLYLPDIEATEFFKNVANYYFSLGLQTLTLSSSKELTRILYANIPECFLASPLAQTLPSIYFHSSLCFLYRESRYRLKFPFWLAKQKVPKVRNKKLDFSPTPWGYSASIPSIPQEGMVGSTRSFGYSPRPQVGSSTDDPRHSLIELNSSQRQLQNFLIRFQESKRRELETIDRKIGLEKESVNLVSQFNIFSFSSGINSALSLHLKDCSFSIIQKVFFCCGDNNLSIGIGLLRSAAKQRNQLNLKNLSVDYVTCGLAEQPQVTQRTTCFAPTVLINNEYSYATPLLRRGFGSLKQKQISYPTISMVFWGFLKPWKMNRFVNIDFRQSLADFLQVLAIPKHTAISAYGIADLTKSGMQPMLPFRRKESFLRNGSIGEPRGNARIPQVRNIGSGNIASQLGGVNTRGLSCYPEGLFTPYSNGVLNLPNNTSLYSCATLRKTADSNAKIWLQSTQKNSVAIEKGQCLQAYRRSQGYQTNTGNFVVEKEFLVHALINNCFVKSLRLVNQNRQLIDYFVDYLIRFQILRQHQILYIFSTLLLTCKK